MTFLFLVPFSQADRIQCSTRSAVNSSAALAFVLQEDAAGWEISFEFARLVRSDTLGGDQHTIAEPLAFFVKTAGVAARVIKFQSYSDFAVGCRCDADGIAARLFSPAIDTEYAFGRRFRWRRLAGERNAAADNDSRR